MNGPEVNPSISCNLYSYCAHPILLVPDFDVIVLLRILTLRFIAAVSIYAIVSNPLAPAVIILA